MPSQGNNTGSVLEKAVALFKQAGLQTGQILLITDSVTKDSSAAVKQLGNYQLSILGIGTEEGAPIALPEGGFLKTDQGSIVVTKLEADTLSNLAQAGNGRYQTVTSDDSDIQNLLTTFNHPEQQGKQRTDITLEQWEEQGVWLLLLVLPIGALFFRKGLLVITLLLLLPFPKKSYALTWQDLWKTRDQQAMQAYQQQDYAQAAEKFTDPAWQAAAQYRAGDYQQAVKSYQNQKKEQTADSWYNQGNALAQAGQLKEALAAYEKALVINPNDADAKFNAELVKKALEKQQPPEQKDSQQNQQNSQQQQDKKDQQSKSQPSNSQKDAKQSAEQPSEQAESQQNQQKQEKGQQQLEQQPEKKEVEQKQQAEQHSTEQKQAEQKTDKKSATQQHATSKPTPQQQADEQWLNRIPDDPAGLLKRKFKYQYGRANQ